MDGDWNRKKHVNNDSLVPIGRLKDMQSNWAMKWEYPKKLNIMGCCVLRDIFGLHENNADYEIKRYVQLASPVSIVSKSPLIKSIDANDDIFENTRQFWRKCQILELKKQIAEYIAEEPADYLIFDVAEFRRKLFFFPDNNGFFSENYVLRGLFERYVDSGILSSKYELYDPLDIDGPTLNRYLAKFCNMLDSLYDRNRMILFEIKAGSTPDDKKADDSVEAEVSTANIFNRRIEYAFGYVVRNLPGIHVVEFPDKVLLDYDHKWGRNLLHYEFPYYDYALKAVNIITKGDYALKEERALLRDIREEYGKRYK